MEDKEHINIKNSATILLLSVANADYNIEKEEIKLIKEIIQDFFSIDTRETYKIVEQAIIDFKKSTSLFEYAQILNKHFTYQDKVDFICCTFEVAFADGTLHYLEEFFIKKKKATSKASHKASHRGRWTNAPEWHDHFLFPRETRREMNLYKSARPSFPPGQAGRGGRRLQGSAGEASLWSS